METTNMEYVGVEDILLSHQYEVSKYMISNDRLLLYHSLGSGKTFTTLAAARYNFWMEPVVLCFSKLVSQNFKNENQEFTKLFPNTYPEVEFLMYVSLCKLSEDEMFSTLRGKFIIIDEAHFTRRGTKGENYYKFMRVMTRLWKEGEIKVMLATGTPIVDSAEDLEGIMEVLNVKDPEDYHNYVSRKKINIRDVEFVGEGTKDLPLKTVNIKLPDSEVENYNQMLSQKFNFYSGLEDYILSTHLKQDLAIENISKSLSTNPKARFFIYCGRIKENGVRYLESCVSNKLGMSSIVITGDESSNLDVRSLETSQVIIGSLASNEGISINNLDEIHIVTPHWNSSIIDQVVGRGTRYSSQKQNPLKVYKYIVYKEAAIALPEYSLDLYKFHKSYQKDKDNSLVLDKFQKLTPKEYNAKTSVLDDYEALVKQKSANYSSSLESLCKYYDHPYIIEGGNIKLVETEVDLEQIVNIDVFYDDEVLNMICNMNYTDILRLLEVSIVKLDYRVLKYFKESIFVVNGETYHTYRYRKPRDRLYGLTYLIPTRRGLTRKLRFYKNGKHEWVSCTTEEERLIWSVIRDRESSPTEAVELMFSISERKFKLKINLLYKTRDKRKEPRGKDILSYNRGELLNIVMHVMNHQTGLIYNEDLFKMNKYDLLRILVHIFYRMGEIRFI